MSKKSPQAQVAALHPFSLLIQKIKGETMRKVVSTLTANTTFIAVHFINPFLQFETPCLASKNNRICKEFYN